MKLWFWTASAIPVILNCLSNSGDFELHHHITDEMREKAREYGMVTLRDAGLNTLWEGITTAEEVIRETIVDG